MLEIVATFSLIFWALGLISGVAVGSTIHVLPLIALTAIVLRLYEATRARADEAPRVAPVHEKVRTQQTTPQAAPATQAQGTREHAKAA